MPSFVRVEFLVWVPNNCFLIWYSLFLFIVSTFKHSISIKHFLSTLDYPFLESRKVRKVCFIGLISLGSFCFYLISC